MKEFLSQKDITYTERNVLKNKGAMEKLKKLGAMVTPLAIINGEIVAGFNQQKLEQLLGD